MHKADEAILKMKLDDSNKLILFEMGLTGHVDMGIVDGNYNDIVHLGPFSKTIKVDKELINMQHNPAWSRFENMKREVKIWFKELKKEAGVQV